MLSSQATCRFISAVFVFMFFLISPSFALIIPSPGDPDPTSTVSTIYIDNNDTDLIYSTGSWISSVAVDGYFEDDYLHDGNIGSSSFTFNLGTALTAPDFYDVELLWTAHPNRATNVTVTLFDGSSSFDFSVDQSAAPQGPASQLFGSFYLELDSYLLISSVGADGYVIADAVRLSPVPEPSTLFLLSGGFLCLASYGWRRKKK